MDSKPKDHSRAANPQNNRMPPHSKIRMYQQARKSASTTIPTTAPKHLLQQTPKSSSTAKPTNPQAPETHRVPTNPKSLYSQTQGVRICHDTQNPHPPTDQKPSYTTGSQNPHIPADSKIHVPPNRNTLHNEPNRTSAISQNRKIIMYHHTQQSSYTAKPTPLHPKSVSTNGPKTLVNSETQK